MAPPLGPGTAEKHLWALGPPNNREDEEEEEEEEEEGGLCCLYVSCSLFVAPPLGPETAEKQLWALGPPKNREDEDEAEEGGTLLFALFISIVCGAASGPRDHQQTARTRRRTRRGDCVACISPFHCLWRRLLSTFSSASVSDGETAGARVIANASASVSASANASDSVNVSISDSPSA